jgi:hypothetical protein
MFQRSCIFHFNSTNNRIYIIEKKIERMHGKSSHRIPYKYFVNQMKQFWETFETMKALSYVISVIAPNRPNTGK